MTSLSAEYYEILPREPNCSPVILFLNSIQDNRCSATRKTLVLGWLKISTSNDDK